MDPGTKPVGFSPDLIISLIFVEEIFKEGIS